MTHLLAQDLRLAHLPELSYKEVVKGYEIRDVWLWLGGGGNVGLVHQVLVRRQKPEILIRKAR